MKNIRKGGDNRQANKNPGNLNDCPPESIREIRHIYGILFP